MKIPRLRIRKNTKGTLAGILIAVGSIYVLSISYDIPRETLLGFLFGSVMLVLAMMLAAIGVVVLYRLLIRLIKKLAGHQETSGQDRP